MLNRRILRIKAFKAVYTYTENRQMDIRELESYLEKSCEAVRTLYLFMMSIIVPLTEEARSRIEAARAKFNPTEEELHPNMKFVGNSIAAELAVDPDFNKLIQRKKLSWEQYDVLLRQLYESIRNRDYFRDYLADPERGASGDAALWIKIFENEFEDNENLEKILEELSIWWNDDLAYALTWCCRSVKAMGEGKRWQLPALYMSEMSDNPDAESDRAFVTKLLRRAVTDYGRYVENIQAHTPQWDLSRICATDLALIVSGMAEADAFPLIPKKVTINEFVEISKYYSTPESRAFVNGLLDRLIEKQ